MFKPLDADTLYKSYRAYEAYVEKEVKAERITNAQAYRFLKSAKENYRNQNHNKNGMRMLSNA